jgi:hypothetical protein
MTSSGGSTNKLSTRYLVEPPFFLNLKGESMVETTKAQNELLEQFRAARRVSTPLVAITTPDPGATERLILDAMNVAKNVPPMLTWDIIRGLRPLNEPGHAAIATMTDVVDNSKFDIVATLAKLGETGGLPAGACLFVHNAARYLSEGKSALVVQAVWNLRDIFKADRRMLVLLSPQFSMPIELQTDVVFLDDPYPDDGKLQEIVREVVAAAEADSKAKGVEFSLKATDDIVKKSAAKLKGTASFAAEQLIAMAVRPDRIDGTYLDIQAKKIVGQTKGLTFESGTETFDDIGGLGFIKEFGGKLFGGPEPPAVIVRIEELEKSMAGAKGDLSGTSGDALQVILSEMEDNGWSGLLAYGCPGAGKSIFAKSLANTYEAKPIRFDVNSTKGSLVGQSEANIRQAMKVIKTIGGSRVFFVASVNRLESLPPELQRRFRCGVWFFDVPDAKERKAIWDINLKRFGHHKMLKSPGLESLWRSGPTESTDEDDLTGADIRNICEMAYQLGVTLPEARKFVVPLKTQSPDAIVAARAMASHRFISASLGGVYHSTSSHQANSKPSRRVSLGD